MASPNYTQTVNKRTVVSTDPGATAGQVDGTVHTYDVPKETIRYELIKENLGDFNDKAFEYEFNNVGKIHSQNT